MRLNYPANRSRLGISFALTVLLGACGTGRNSIIPPTPVVNLAPEAVVTFAVVGDVMMHGPQIRSGYDPACSCYDYRDVFEHVTPSISAADVAIAALETTLPGDPSRYRGYPEFGAPDAIVDALAEAGFDILTLANNHSADNGGPVIARTLATIHGRGVGTLGTYSDREDYDDRRVLMVEQSGLRLAIFNYTYGTNSREVPPPMRVNRIQDQEAIRRDLALARERGADMTIVLLHFGEEYGREPDDFQRRTVESFFFEGADVVLGGHPHVLQPYELREVTDRFGETRKRLVVWSLGNFFSNQRLRYRDGGMIFHFTLRRPAGEDAVRIEDVRDEPTWVWRMTDRQRNRYFILPVTPFLANEVEPRLSDAEHQSLLRFHEDTDTHLAASRASVQQALAVQADEPVLAEDSSAGN